MVFGSVLVWLTRDMSLGRNKDERLATINARRLEHYATRPGDHKLPKINMTNITRDNWGNLSGPAYKAAITRAAAPFFFENSSATTVLVQGPFTPVCGRS